MQCHFQPRYTLILVLLLLVFVYPACQQQTLPHKNLGNGTKLKFLTLPGHLAKQKSEISGLAWYKDQLILLVQYPDRFTVNDTAAIFRIDKAEILQAITADRQIALTAHRIQLPDRQIVSAVTGFEGYEAVVFAGDRVFFLMECRSEGLMSAYLVSGTIKADMSIIVPDRESLRQISLPLQITNYAFETLVLFQNTLLALYEANGRYVYPVPQATAVHLATEQVMPMPLPNIEFRITDASSADQNGRFWLINYYWPGDDHKLNLVEFNDKHDDAKIERALGVERLIECQISPTAIKLTEKPPIEIHVGKGEDSFNWEGLVRLDDLGFLIASDRHPQTYLAFVPHKLD